MESNEQEHGSLLFEGDLTLQKFEMKGGWVYAELPLIPKNNSTPFGMMDVKGSIDNYQITKAKLMPLGGGKLFLPVKSEIRKQINKDVGDVVSVVLYGFKQIELTEKDILECLDDDELKVFNDYSSEKKRKTIHRILSANRPEETEILIKSLIDELKCMSKSKH